MSGFWSDTKDIELEVIKSLQTFSRREDLTGWIKGSESVDTVALTEELARLSKENAELREQNLILHKKRKNDNDLIPLGVSNEEIKQILESTEISHKIVKNDFFNKWDSDLIVDNLLKLFQLLRKTLSSGLSLSNREQKKIRILEILSQSGLVTIEIERIKIKDVVKTINIARISESGFQFLNWLDLQKIESTTNNNET